MKLFNELFYENDLICKTEPKIKNTYIGHNVYLLIIRFY